MSYERLRHELSWSIKENFIEYIIKDGQDEIGMFQKRNQQINFKLLWTLHSLKEVTKSRFLRQSFL